MNLNFILKLHSTVANFEKLANEGFYDGLTFHRVILASSAKADARTELVLSKKLTTKFIVF